MKAQYKGKNFTTEVKPSVRQEFYSLGVETQSEARISLFSIKKSNRAPYPQKQELLPSDQPKYRQNDTLHIIPACLPKLKPIGFLQVKKVLHILQKTFY